jgi:hypothetical protein
MTKLVVADDYTGLERLVKKKKTEVIDESLAADLMCLAASRGGLLCLEFLIKQVKDQAAADSLSGGGVTSSKGRVRALAGAAGRSAATAAQVKRERERGRCSISPNFRGAPPAESPGRFCGVAGGGVRKSIGAAWETCNGEENRPPASSPRSGGSGSKKSRRDRLIRLLFLLLHRDPVRVSACVLGTCCSLSPL